MSDKLKLVAVVLGIIGTSISGFLFVDNRTATIATDIVRPVKARLSALDKKVQLNELKDLLREAQEELLFWKRQKRKYPDDPEVDEELQQAKDRVTDLKARIRDLEKELEAENG